MVNTSGSGMTYIPPSALVAQQSKNKKNVLTGRSGGGGGGGSSSVSRISQYLQTTKDGIRDTRTGQIVAPVGTSLKEAARLAEIKRIESARQKDLEKQKEIEKKRKQEEAKKIEIERQRQIQEQQEQLRKQKLQNVLQISAAEDITFRDVGERAISDIRSGQSIRDISSNIVSGIGSVIKKPIKKEREIQEERQRLKEEMETPVQVERSFVPSGRGTLIKETRSKVKEEELKDIAKQEGPRGEAAERLIAEVKYQNIQTEYNRDMDNFINKKQSETQNKYDSLVEKVNEGKISVDEANKQINAINANNEQELKNFNKTWQKTKGERLTKEAKEYLNKLSGEILLSRTINKLPLVITAGIVTGGISSVLSAAGTAGRTVMIGADVAGISAAAYQTQKFISYEVAQGTLTKEKLISVGLNLASFGAGVKIGSKFATGKKINVEKLNRALETSKFKIKEGSIIKEKNIMGLKISEEMKVELVGRIRAGETLRKIDVDIKAASSADQKIIDQALPNRKIQFIEASKSIGNKIVSRRIGVFSSKKGFINFERGIMSETYGEITPEGVESKTLSVIGKSGKPVEEVLLTREITKGQRIKLDKGFRLETAETKVSEIGRIKEKPIKQKDILELSLIEKRGTPVSQEKFLELQKLGKLRVDLTPKGDYILVNGKKVYLGVGVGESKKIFESPIKKPVSKITKISPSEEKAIIKKVEEFKSAGEIVKISEQREISRDYPTYVGGSQVQSIESQMARISPKKMIVGDEILNIRPLGSADVVLRDIVRNVPSQYPKISIVPLDVDVISGKLDQKSKMALKEKNLEIYSQKMNQRFNQILDQSQNILAKSGQKQRLKEDQLLEEGQSFLQKMQIPQFQSLPELTPKIMRVKPEIKPIKITSPKNIDQELKKLNRTPKYTSSVSEALFGGKPLEVSEKEFKKLQKVEFTDLELRPILSIKSSKKTKRKKR